MDFAADAAADGRTRGQEGQGQAEEVTGALAALHGRIAGYYTGKLERHGATPAGVDWSCEPTQQLRFVQLLRGVDLTQPCSLNDLGCGYGALLAFIARRHPRARLDYCGTDVSEAMVREARRLWQKRPDTVFHVGAASPRTADWSVASGIFNVRIDEPLALWETFIADALRSLAAGSRCGFAVNFLKLLPPGMTGTPQLYRCDPAPWIAFCEAECGVRVELLDAYGMREFTLLARR